MTTTIPDLAPEALTALLIDDEEPIRRIVHRMLEPGICRVVEAADAETGLRCIERDQPHIDLVVTDLLMPGLDGLDVLDVLHQHRPDLPILVTSAFTGSIYPVLNRGGHLRILQKPFTADALREAMALLVGQAQAMRQRAVEIRAWAAEVRAANARVHEGNAAMQQRQLDLVAAAWAVHRERETHRNNRGTPLGA
jgi:CheY-like chemotaxis protein